ncbi:hypothetical protein ElyMa_000845300 [Elysia marginata]|uniref:Uncharacterized protein n=1 Tax=Elysia marginata TaxID=1093978 RepID=A0AAV4H0I0_9GAST|nr:hypothetical protein ElyMa_000845300 [Elysia marginata]
MKTNKAVLLHKLEEAEIALTSRHPEISDIHVIDGNALLQSLIGLPDTFGELALKVFTCLPSASVVHFVTDRYDDLSIKDIERVRRGQDDCNTHNIRGPSTKVPATGTHFCPTQLTKQQSSVFCCLSGKMTNMPLDYRDACFALATKTRVPY